MLAKSVLRVGLILVLGVILLGGSCRVKTAPPEPTERPVKPETTPGGPAAAEKDKPMDVGDAEAALQLSLTIPEPVPPNMTVEELRNPVHNNLDMLTATVAPPHPQRLDVALTLKATKPFRERPVIARITVLRDGQPIESQSMIVSGDPGKEPFSYTFDAMKGVTAAPASMLLHAQAELVMLPEGTDVATIDPATATGTAESTGSKVSNPLRINFAAQAVQ